MAKRLKILGEPQNPLVDQFPLPFGVYTTFLSHTHTHTRPWLNPRNIGRSWAYKSRLMTVHGLQFTLILTLAIWHIYPKGLHRRGKAMVSTGKLSSNGGYFRHRTE